MRNLEPLSACSLALPGLLGAFGAAGPSCCSRAVPGPDVSARLPPWLVLSFSLRFLSTWSGSLGVSGPGPPLSAQPVSDARELLPLAGLCPRAHGAAPVPGPPPWVPGPGQCSSWLPSLQPGPLLPEGWWPWGRPPPWSRSSPRSSPCHPAFWVGCSAIRGHVPGKL